MLLRNLAIFNCRSNRNSLSSKLTLSDCSALYLAKKLNAPLLTGDNTLRKQSKRDNIEAHGILWVLDQLVGNRIITAKSAAKRLKSIIEAGSRLPKPECQKRLAKWG